MIAAKVYAMLGNESQWQTATLCHGLLQRAEIPHAVIGGVAVCLHGYQRNTVDLDLLVRCDDAQFVRETGLPVRLFLADEPAGKDSEVRLPDPSDRRFVTELEGLPVLTLAKLIECKLACGQGDLRRTHKDFADVVELIACHDLGSSFARHLHKSLRTPYRELVRHARGA